MKKQDCIYELPAARRWYHRLVLWLRRIIGKPAPTPPRYFMAWDIGRTRDTWVKSKIYPDGTIEIVETGYNQKPENDSGMARRPSDGRAADKLNENEP